ncbi:MAG: efflux transporter periplasmic adaptor subunit, partial [Roseicyclus sp.]|nr:efflux transporter periplasmic adaptor subunit [Roseicyclus sp.]
GDDVLIRARGLQGREVVLARTPALGAGIRVNPIRDADAPPAEPETIALDPDRRARLIAFVEGNGFIPQDVKARMLNQLQQDEVPAQMVDRLESRMGS